MISCGGSSEPPTDAPILIDVRLDGDAADTFNVEDCLLGPMPPTTRECCEYTGDRWLEAAGICVAEP